MLALHATKQLFILYKYFNNRVYIKMMTFAAPGFLSFFAGTAFCHQSWAKCIMGRHSSEKYIAEQAVQNCVCTTTSCAIHGVKPLCQHSAFSF